MRQTSNRKHFPKWGGFGVIPAWIDCPEGLGGLLALALALVAASLTGCQIGEFSMTLEPELTQPSVAESPISTETSTANSTESLSGVSPTTAPSVTPGCVNQAEFVTDLSVPDGSQLAPGELFLKTWRLRNSGTCTWDQTYTFFFAGGNRLDAFDAQPLPGVVPPGQTVDLTVPMTAPQLDGNYRGDWLLMSPEGSSFGIGPDGRSPFWVSIVVGAGSSPGKATPVSDTPAAGICGQVEGEVATMIINPDVPDPR
ncbi:MAG: NBR1-Ig-like domain-containing protein, partial [Anaerolineales bacterium]